MAVKSRQAQHSASTRAALVRIARRLFAEHGYTGTATEEVVRRAHVTRGALYHHFRDKKDLFMAVLDEEQKKLAVRAMEVAAAQPDPWSAMIASANAFLDACLDHAVQQIVLIDGPAVLGLEQWREEGPELLSGQHQGRHRGRDRDGSGSAAVGRCARAHHLRRAE